MCANQLTIKSAGLSQAAVLALIASTPPPSHKTQHQLSGSDELNVTGLTGAGGGALFPSPLHVLSSVCESLDGYEVQVSGSGFAIITAIGITGNSGSTINSNCLVTKYLDGILNHYDFDKSRQFEVLSYLDFEVSATGKLYILHGYDETYNSIGFAVINGVLKGFVANTTNETTVNLQTISSEGFEVARSLKVVFTAGIKCEFYVDNVLLGTITTGLPSGDYGGDRIVFFKATNPTVAENKRFTIATYTITLLMT